MTTNQKPNTSQTQAIRSDMEKDEYPKVQYIWWFPEWKGFRRHMWPGNMSKILHYSILLGWLEIRVWRSPNDLPR